MTPQQPPKIQRHHFKNVKPQWESINKRQPDLNLSCEFLLKLPWIKTTVNLTLADPTSHEKVNANDFELMEQTNTSTAQCKQLCGNGNVWPELLPIMCDNYKQSKWSCTKISMKKVNFIRNLN